MKRKTILITSVIGVAVLIAAVLGICGCVNNEAPKPVTVFRCMPSDISRYVVHNDAEGYALIKSGDGWQLENNDVAVLKQDEVTKIVNGASMITAQKTLKKKEIQGFQEITEQKVEIHLSDGKEYVFDFIAVNSTACVMRDNSTGELYQVSLSVRDTLVVPIDRFRELRVYQDLKEEDGVLTAFSYTDYNGEETVIRQKTASEISKRPLNRYVMEVPYKRDVDDESFEQQITVKIPMITVAKYVDDFPKDPSEYGLDAESRAELKFTWADKTHTLHLGKNENGLVYATKDDSDSIFFINSARLEFLDADPFYVLDTEVLESEAEYIRSVTVRKDGETYSLRRTAQGSANALYYVNNKAASKYTFEKAINALGEIRLLNALITAPQQKDAIELEILYDNRQSAQRLKLIPLSEKEYALFTNNTAEFAVDKSAVDSLFAVLETISNNPMQTGEKG